VLAVKDNQPTLSEAIQLRFAYLREHPFEAQSLQSCTRHGKGHGRLETRYCELITLQANDPLWGDFQQEWAGLRSLACITCTRQIGDKVSQGSTLFHQQPGGSSLQGAFCGASTLGH